MTNLLESSLKKIHAAGYSGYFSSLFNIESGQVGISDERMPNCEVCYLDESTTSDCASCGRTPENFFRFRSGGGDGVYGLVQLFDPLVEDRVLGGLLIFNKSVVESMYTIVADEGNSPSLDLDFSDVLPELEGEFIGHVSCYGPLTEAEEAGDVGQHVLYVGDANSDDSGEFALTSFYCRPGTYAVYLFGDREAALVIPKERAREFGLSEESAISDDARTEYALGKPDEDVLGHMVPAGLQTLVLNVNLTLYDPASEDENFRGQLVNHMAWVAQIASVAPELMPDNLPEFQIRFIKELGKKDLASSLAQMRGFKLPEVSTEEQVLRKEPRAWDEPPVTEFSIITSPLDGDYDPVAFFNNEVILGLRKPKDPYSQKENAEKNQSLISNLKAFKNDVETLVGDRPHSSSDECREISEEDPDLVDELAEILLGLELISCDSYTEESSDAYCDFLDTLLEYDKLFDQCCQDEYFEALENWLGFLRDESLPRPVVWKIINEIDTTDMCIETADMSAPYLSYAIGENELIGDRAYLAHLGNSYHGTPPTVYAAYGNSSLTIESLEKLETWYFRMAIDGSHLHDWHPFGELHIFSGLYNYEANLEDFMNAEVAPRRVGILPSLADLAFVLARILDEFKVGRLTWQRLSQSPNEIYRSIAAYWPGISVEDRRALMQTGIVEFNSQTEDFLNYTLNHPHVSVLSMQLAERPLP